MSLGIRVTVTDLESGEASAQDIWDDYVVVTAGNRYVHHVQTFGNGTHVITVKVDPEAPR